MQRSIPDGHVRVSVKFGSRWFAADLPVSQLRSEMGRLTHGLNGARHVDQARGFVTAAMPVIDLLRSAAAGKDVRTVCLAALWVVFHRPPDAQAAQDFFLEIIEFGGCAWVGVSADESGSLASFSYDSYDIAPAHLAEVDTGLQARERLPAHDNRPITAVIDG
ncbi:hypothetical protein SAE02_54680 [Skermanella aerolata]|uniref:Uncharacterized protein n=1 Tax=Skermanella aerolata TaxID=393310 RepID=A0A512DYP7_9PROT|nr:hypothetical protein [Skermanella aerolata]GEO41320.1 hypothetical protein SAE02_54680 [Skermanella aerolata]